MGDRAAAEAGSAPSPSAPWGTPNPPPPDWRCRAVVWDLDGLLLDSESVCREARTGRRGETGSRGRLGAADVGPGSPPPTTSAAPPADRPPRPPPRSPTCCA